MRQNSTSVVQYWDWEGILMEVHLKEESDKVSFRQNLRFHCCRYFLGLVSPVRSGHPTYTKYKACKSKMISYLKKQKTQIYLTFKFLSSSFSVSSLSSVESRYCQVTSPIQFLARPSSSQSLLVENLFPVLQYLLLLLTSTPLQVSKIPFPYHLHWYIHSGFLALVSVPRGSRLLADHHQRKNRFSLSDTNFVTSATSMAMWISDCWFTVHQIACQQLQPGVKDDDTRWRRRITIPPFGTLVISLVLTRTGVFIRWSISENYCPLWALTGHTLVLLFQFSLSPCHRVITAALRCF